MSVHSAASQGASPPPSVHRTTSMASMRSRSSISSRALPSTKVSLASQRASLLAEVQDTLRSVASSRASPFESRTSTPVLHPGSKAATPPELPLSAAGSAVHSRVATLTEAPLSAAGSAAHSRVATPTEVPLSAVGSAVHSRVATPTEVPLSVPEPAAYQSHVTTPTGVLLSVPESRVATLTEVSLPTSSPLMSHRSALTGPVADSTAPSPADFPLGASADQVHEEFAPSHPSGFSLEQPSAVSTPAERPLSRGASLQSLRSAPLPVDMQNKAMSVRSHTPGVEAVQPEAPVPMASFPSKAPSQQSEALSQQSGVKQALSPPPPVEAYTSAPPQSMPSFTSGPYKLPSQEPYHIPVTSYAMQQQVEAEMVREDSEGTGVAAGDVYEPTAATPTPHPSVASAHREVQQELCSVQSSAQSSVAEEEQVEERSQEVPSAEEPAQGVTGVVGRKPWEPPAAEELSQYVHIHSDAVVEKYRTDPTAALEIASASVVQDIAKDFIDEMNELKLALFKMTAERDELLAEIERLRARLLEPRPVEEQQVVVVERQEVQDEAPSKDGSGIILNWALFQKQLRAAQADAARLRKELIARHISEGRAERAEEALKKAEMVMLEAQAAYGDLSAMRHSDISALSGENIMLRMSVNARVPREELHSIELKLADKEKQLLLQKQQSEMLQSGLRDDLAAARNLVVKVETEAAQREERLRELLMQSGEEQNRLLQQLILSEKALLPELRNELLLQQDTIARLLRTNSALEDDKEHLKADVVAAETLAEATENEREALEKQLGLQDGEIEALKNELDNAKKSAQASEAVRKELAELKGLAQHLGDQVKERDTYILSHKNTVSEMRVEHAAELKNAVDRVTSSLRVQSGELLGRHLSMQSMRSQYHSTRKVAAGSPLQAPASQRTASRGMVDAIHILHDTFVPMAQPRNVSPTRERHARHY